MSRLLRPRLYVWALSLLPLLAAGCSSGVGRGAAGGFGLFTQNYQLIEPAKEMRWANSSPLQVPRELEKQPLPTYVVVPGDVLLVLPSDLDSPVRLPGDQPVLPDGTINLGKYGMLLVAGKTIPEIQALVQSTVAAQTKDPGYITVRLISRVGMVFYVVGEVNAPGAFPLNGRETVLDAIMAAGGLTYNASPDNIILSRPSRPNCPRTVLPVCYRNIVQLGDTTTNYQIAPGDRIFVPSKSFHESIFGSNSRRSPTPCCGLHAPNALPPYPGGPCVDPPHGAPIPPPALDLPRPVEGSLPLPAAVSRK